MSLLSDLSLILLAVEAFAMALVPLIHSTLAMVQGWLGAIKVDRNLYP